MPPSPRRRSARRYYALIVPGIEPLAASELERAGATIDDTVSGFDRRNGIVLFSTSDISAALYCGTVEAVFGVLFDAPTPPSMAELKRVTRTIAPPAFESAALEHHSLRPRRHGRSYRVVSRMSGRHAFQRSELEQVFTRSIGALMPHWSAREGPVAMEFWVHAVGDRTIAGLRLSGDELSQRAPKRVHLPASLKPTVARALVMLSEPRPEDIFVDPMAGAGTILRERAGVARSRAIVGGDIDAGAVAAARANCGRGASLSVWDATHLPVRPKSVDVVVTNPPYGRQHEAAGDLVALYRQLLGESARILRPGGRCLVLTGEPAALRSVVPKKLVPIASHRWIVRGLDVTAFVMRRK